MLELTARPPPPFPTVHRLLDVPTSNIISLPLGDNHITLMSQRPLWKRVGVQQPHHKQPERNWKSERVLPVPPESPTKLPAQPTRNSTTTSIVEVSQETSNDSINCQQEIFRECIRKFQRLNEEQRESDSDCNSKRNGRGQQQAEQPTVELKKVRNNRNAKELVGEVTGKLRSLKRQLSAVRKSVALEKAWMLQNVGCLRGYIQAYTVERTNISSKVNRACQTDNSDDEISKDCMFSTRPSSSQPADMFRSHRSEEQQSTTFLELLQLKQKLELAAINSRLLQQELAALHRSMQQQSLLASSKHSRQLEELSSRNTQTMKEAASKHLLEVLLKDQTISQLRGQLASQTERLAFFEKKSSEPPTNSTNEIYLKKYRNLYELAEQERVKLAAANHRSTEELQQVRLEIEQLQKQSTELVDQNIELQKRLDEANFKYAELTDSYRSVSRQLSAKKAEHEQAMQGYKRELNRKSTEIGFLDKRLADTLNRSSQHIRISRQQLSTLEFSVREQQPKQQCQTLQSAKSATTVSNIRHVVQRNDYLKAPSMTPTNKRLGLTNFSKDCYGTTKNEFDQLRKSFRKSLRATTEDSTSELSARVQNLSAMMRCEIQTSFRRLD